MNKKQQFEKLQKEMLACEKCSLRKGCRQVVPGSGSVDAKIMFIGEGPGAKEDELGEPFVGASGKFLNEMLASVNLKRGDIYIANVVKCRPVGNRDPRSEEKKICWEWLEKQIKIIQPKLIITLGKHAMESFLPNQKISQCHGRALRRKIPIIGEYVFFTLYHPAAALYNGSMREILIKDFKKVPKILELIEKEKNSQIQ